MRSFVAASLSLRCRLLVTKRLTSFDFYVDYIDTNGERLFELACERDLEGIVAKHRHSRYIVEDGNPTWMKIRNPRYSQMVGRDELFERRYEAAALQRLDGACATRRVPPQGDDWVPGTGLLALRRLYYELNDFVAVLR